MKLLKRLFYEPRHAQEEKVTDQVLTRSIIISVIGILFCMTCLFGLTWAWFSTSVTTGTNKITAATFDLDITVKQGTESTVTMDENGYYILDPVKTYTVSLAKKGTAKTGFCHLSVVTATSDFETATAYYTDSIPKIDDTTKEETEPFVFTVSGILKIKFTPMWGKCPEDQAEKIVRYDDKKTLSLGTVSSVPTDTKTGEKKSSGEATQSASETTTPSAITEQQTTVSETTVPSTETTTSETTGTPETQSTEPYDTVQTEPDVTAVPSEQTDP